MTYLVLGKTVPTRLLSDLFFAFIGSSSLLLLSLSSTKFKIVINRLFKYYFQNNIYIDLTFTHIDYSKLYNSQ